MWSAFLAVGMGPPEPTMRMTPRAGEDLSPRSRRQECATVRALWRTAQRFLTKLNTQSSKYTPWHLPKGLEDL